MELEPMEGQAVPTDCWPHFELSAEKVNHRPASFRATCGQHVESPTRC